VGEVDPGHRALGRAAQVGLGQVVGGDSGQQVGGVDQEALIQPDLPGDGAGSLLGQPDEDVSGRRVGPALEEAGQQEVTLVPPDQLVIVVGDLTAGEQLLGLELDQDGGHQQELGELVEVDLVPLLGEDAHERIDHRQQRDVQHIDLM
jgi:hypothetical protein